MSYVMLNKLWTRLHALLRKSEMDRELDEEFNYHIEQQTEQNIRMGMNPEEARHAARKAFSGMEQAKERSRDARGVRWLEELWQDLRFSARMLIKNPGFTLVAALTLALGIGANTAIFSVVNGVLLRPLPYKDPERLVMVFAPRRLDQEFLISSGGFTVLRNQNQVFEQVAAFLPMLDSSSITGDGEPEFLGGVTVSANLFTLLGVEAKYGRTFLPVDCRVRIDTPAEKSAVRPERYRSADLLCNRAATGAGGAGSLLPPCPASDESRSDGSASQSVSQIGKPVPRASETDSPCLPSGTRLHSSR
jgi:hypothetical protein